MCTYIFLLHIRFVCVLKIIKNSIQLLFVSDDGKEPFFAGKEIIFVTNSHQLQWRKLFAQ